MNLCNVEYCVCRKKLHIVVLVLLALSIKMLCYVVRGLDSVFFGSVAIQLNKVPNIAGFADSSDWFVLDAFITLRMSFVLSLLPYLLSVLLWRTKATRTAVRE